ncbi:MAG: lysostaphin resistance A-like protein [Rubrobacter sp.]
MDLFLDRNTGRLRTLWRLLVQYCAFRVLVLLVFNLFVVTLVLAESGGRPGASVIPDSPLIPLFSAAAGLVGAVLSVWLAGRFLDRRPLPAFGFRLGAGWWLDLLFGMALGAVLITTVFLVELGLGWVEVTSVFETDGVGAPFAISILLPATTFVCVGISEETVFRGYQLKNAAEGLNYPALGPRGAVLLAWVLSSVFFAVLHADNPNATTISTLNIVLAGFMLGFGYVISGELAIPIGLHITWNFFQGAVYGFPVSGFGSFGAAFLSTRPVGPDLWTGGSFGPEGGLLVPAVMLLGMLLIALWSRLRTGKVAIDASVAERPDQSTPPARET